MSVDPSNATVTSGVDAARARIAGAIKQAANNTGASFEYLLTTAKMESDFNPTAGASTSSAHGLFQFINQTWLGTVKEAGAQLGYGGYADAITKSPNGNYSVRDPAALKAIMKLRDDPAASSAMAGVLTQSNSFKLTGKIGRRPTDNELYMAHFMGVGGAAKLISNAEDNPQASGARLFPNAAAANRSIFYERSGRARSVSEVYSVLTQRYASAANSQATRSAMASVGVMPTTTSVASAAPIAAPARISVASAAPIRPPADVPITARIDNAAILSSLPESRPAPPITTVAPITVASASTADTSPPADPAFRSLFQAGERTQPVSPTVRELWGNSASLTADPPATVASASPVAPADSSSRLVPAAPSQGLDLFSDRSGVFSG